MAGMAAAARGSARFPIVLRLHPTVPNRLAAGWETVCLRDRAAWDAAVVARHLGRLERTDPRLVLPFLHYTQPRPYVLRMIRLPAEVHATFQARAQRHGLTHPTLGLLRPRKRVGAVRFAILRCPIIILIRRCKKRR